MIAAFPMLISVMLLTDPGEVVDAAAAASISEDANRVEIRGTQSQEVAKSARITSRASDFDRKAGVAMFEGNVVVRYSNDCTMCSDRLWMFLAGSNELSRVVATGNVSITNATRIGTCSMATYRRKKNEIEMFGSGTNTLASLRDGGDEAGALSGTRIRFWLDTEQVEVENSRIESEQKKEGMNFL